MHDFQPGSPPCVHPDHGGAQGQIQEEASGQGCVWGELQWPEFSHHLALPRGHAPVEPAQTPPHEALQVGLGRRAGPGGEGRHQDCRYGVRTGQEEAVRGVWGVRGEGLLVSGFLRQKVVFPAVLASVCCSCWTSGFCPFLSTSSAAGFAWINSQHTCVLLYFISYLLSVLWCIAAAAAVVNSCVVRLPFVWFCRCFMAAVTHQSALVTFPLNSTVFSIQPGLGHKFALKWWDCLTTMCIMTLKPVKPVFSCFLLEGPHPGCCQLLKCWI